MIVVIVTSFLTLLYVSCAGPSEPVVVPEGWWEYMTKEEEPNPGPERDTVYVPGTPGGQWTAEEVDATRSLTFSFLFLPLLQG